MTDKHQIIGDSAKSDEIGLGHVYQPILRGYFAVAGIYYLIMVALHIALRSGVDRLYLTSASVLAAAVCALGWRYLGESRRLPSLELVTSVVNLLIITNVMIAIEVEFKQGKLVYFIMMAMIFAFACASVRQALISLVAVYAGLYFELSWYAPDQFKTYGFVAFASGVAAIGITFFLRRTVAVALAAREQAEQDRLTAESRLQTAHEMSEDMRRQSLTDSLTGLPNRRAFFDELQLRGSHTSGAAGVWLILLDLDGFKAVNDNYGHLIGDELLKAVSSRLLNYCGSEIHISRIGGDEFNILAPATIDETAIEIWCNDLLANLGKVYLIENHQILISGSIGCCRSDVAQTEIGLIQMADYALLHAKRSGKNRITLFRDEHASDAAKRFRIEQALRFADFATEFELVFQPQLNLATERIDTAEALVRWNSPILGPIAPDSFILIAEESGLIAKITLAVLEKTIATIKQSKQTMKVSLNLSGHDILSDYMVEEIIDRVRASGVAPALIEFEITETAIMPDIERARSKIAKLAEHGHSIALDDFGTGYSNFRYLQTLPISKLKVDRAFMENIGDPTSVKLLHSLAGMAKTLSVQCLFEGVENEIELLLAKQAGAQAVQGYLIGRPMSWAQLEALDAADFSQFKLRQPA